MVEGILRKVTYHAVYDASILEALRYAGTKGFAGVQVAVETPHLSFEALSDGECSDIAEFRAAKGLWISLHAPDTAASLFQTSKYLSRGIFDYYEALFAFSERIGTELITFHPGTVTAFRMDGAPGETIPRADLSTCRQTLERNLKRLIDLARGRFILCVENYEMQPLVLDVLQPCLDTGRLSLCWDLAKTFDAHMKRQEDLEDYFWRNLKHVRQVHLHDVRDGLSHRVVGSGGLDFMHFLPRLAETDVAEYCIEVRPREKAAESLANLRKLIQHHAASR